MFSYMLWLLSTSYVRCTSREFIHQLGTFLTRKLLSAYNNILHYIRIIWRPVLVKITHFSCPWNKIIVLVPCLELFLIYFYVWLISYHCYHEHRTLFVFNHFSHNVQHGVSYLLNVENKRYDQNCLLYVLISVCCRGPTWSEFLRPVLAIRVDKVRL